MRSASKLTVRSIAVVIGVLAAAVVTPTARASATCPTTIDESFASEGHLGDLNQVMADAGPRPTAAPSHERYINWIEHQLDAMPGLAIRSMRYTIDRWLERGARLTLTGVGRPKPIRVAGAVPYTRAATVRGPLMYVPTGTAIADVDVQGKIVVRDRPILGGPQAIFLAVTDYLHDPDHSIDLAGNYERDASASVGVRTDLEQAADRGAAGLVFAATVPHGQAFSYAPYDGTYFDVPALQVGVDEGAALKAASGRTVELVVAATRTPQAPTRNLIATLPGRSAERIVIASHTDGMNAVWDNGPTAILALAEYFSVLPLECRPRTIEFAFTTAHLYQSDTGARRYAEELDRGYEEGTVAFAVALEHLGAKEYLTVPRPAGGVELRPTGESEIFVTFSNESPATKAALISSIIGRDLRRTFALRGADAPQASVPPHRSYGGEGGVYHSALIPTVAGITGPNTLFKPSFDMDELLDVELMRRQAMAFGDIVLALDDVPRELIAGADTLYRRAARDAAQPPAQARSTAPPFYGDLLASLASPAGSVPLTGPGAVALGFRS